MSELTHDGTLLQDIAKAEALLSKSRKLDRDVILGRIMDKHLNTIKALARTPQPVTPAGGKVGPAATVMCVTDTTTHIGLHGADLPVGTKLYTHPPVADAALVRDAERYRHLRDAHSEKWTDAATGSVLTCTVDFCGMGHDIDAAVDSSMQDAALNQRGGGCGSDS